MVNNWLGIDPDSGWREPAFSPASRDRPVPPRQTRDDEPPELRERSRLPADAPPEGANLRELIAILSRRRLALAVGVALTTGLALAYLAVVPAAYTATTSILIDARTRAPLGTDASSIAASSPDTVLIESQVRLIGSDAVLSRVVADQKLAEDADYVSTRPGLLTLVPQLFGGGAKAPAGGNGARALAAFSRNVVARRSERTYVIDVDVTARSAQKAADLANAVASAFIADRAATRLDGAKRDSAALNTRLADLQKRLSEAETRVQTYKQSHQIYDANGKRINEQELTDGATALSLARTKTAEAKSRYDQIQRIIAAGRPTDAVTEALKSNLIDRLRGQYADVARQEANYRTTLGDRHPALIETHNQLLQIKSLITEELRRIAAGAANEYQTARSNEQAAERQVGALKKGTDVTSLAAVELRELEHDVDASKAVYDKFLRARDTIGDDGPEGQFARVIAPAVPPVSPSAPKTATILALALASGLFGGIAQAFFAEYLVNGEPLPERRGAAPTPMAMDRRKNNRWLNIWPFARKYTPVAAIAPAAVDDPAEQPPLEAQTPSAEPPPRPDAMHAFFYSLLPDDIASRNDAQPFTILVTSLEEKSGKTATAIALAQAAAQDGARVLLIEANNNAPVLKRHVADTPPDLIDLMGTLRLCHHLAQAPTVRVVPISDGEDMQVRRLSRRDAPAIDGIAGNFDIVVLDGGAIGPDADLAMVAEAADSIVLASRSGALSRGEISAALDALDVERARLGGVWETGAQAAA